MLSVTAVRTELTLQPVTMEESTIGGSISMEASADGIWCHGQGIF